MMKKYMLVLGLVVLFMGCAHGVDSEWSVFAVDDAGTPDAVTDVASDRIEAGSDGNFPPGSFDLGTPETLAMNYYGGPVLTQPINVYFIWYGNWTDTRTQPILEDLIKGMGTSPWWQISAAYWQQPTPIINDDGGADFGGQISNKHRFRMYRANPSLDAGVESGSDAAIADAGTDAADASFPPQPFGYVAKTVNFVKSVNVGYPLGTQLQDADITTIVAQATSTVLPLDPNGVYFVLASSDVSETSGFCWGYCGWHGNQTISGVDIKLAYIGDTGACPQGCSLQPEYQQFGLDASPNNDWSADSMASVIAHELSESATDSDANTNVAWMDQYGNENADKCAWTFGAVYHTDGGSIANVNIGGRDFMIQQDWVLDSDGGHCGLHP